MVEFKKAAQVVLLNEEGEILAVSRKDDHDDFGLIGGKVDPEDYIGNIMDGFDLEVRKAAFRETIEETGLRINNLRLIYVAPDGNRMCYTFIADYYGTIQHNEPHVVKWTNYQTVLDGTFGHYNEAVLRSLQFMGVKVKM